MPHAVVKEELNLLSHVLDQLEGEEERARNVRLRRSLDHAARRCSVAKPEDLPPIVEQMHRVAALAKQHGRGRLAAVDRGSPYFGHIRLRENGKDRDVLIGRVSHVDTNKGVRIVDWRNAPVSRLYYCYGEGDDYHEVFGTRPMSGKVEVQRAVTVAESRLRGWAPPAGTFVLRPGSGKRVSEQQSRLMGGQGKAFRPSRVENKKRKKKLGVGPDGLDREDKHLPEITALIDPQQFELITHPDSGLVVIRGGAGSGKTTVGLHRIAYLGYRDPERYRPDRMLVVVYNQALEAYIGQVLPELGFAGVTTVTFIDGRLRFVVVTSGGSPGGMPRHAAGGDPRKKHPRMLDALEEIAKRKRSLRHSIS